ncbi:hypothetical protein Mp_8g04970 [Marchantia polymorpha subsp. ruderalis]|uniref:Uncharacterized protein n=1 Tax=Marchantia polymorpha TaxID=3197 RepID=A0A2R6VX92_MARPO|nr:hypothetical protein MARPO_4405s0001 [Marchantia polymorpha]PTQ26220.1 hypothetical protein MARPO_4405s0001 [Marchantia polymorpha]BBN18728.1 hypothetical protein Mp_8g04970 [Marchantia polymorpha subsp. ruderalis]BBN18729.1 hypothetical protein Mp_8g04970 [Marchantia polymorpha subsp. ruderalis]|eukprot:PTQ26219.1 hypothetical protein MARPO_4405s0001 [Marchantia polymorpha]
MLRVFPLWCKFRSSSSSVSGSHFGRKVESGREWQIHQKQIDYHRPWSSTSFGHRAVKFHQNKPCLSDSESGTGFFESKRCDHQHLLRIGKSCH